MIDAKYLPEIKSKFTKVEDMKSCIQEWMAQSLSAVELARTYSELKEELDRQMEFCMRNFMKEEKP